MIGQVRHRNHLLLRKDGQLQLVEDLEDVGLFSVESLPNGIHLVLWYVRDQFSRDRQVGHFQGIALTYGALHEPGARVCLGLSLRIEL